MELENKSLISHYKSRKNFEKKDVTLVLILLIFLFLAVFFIYYSFPEGNYAYVYVDGKEIMQIDLSENKEYELKELKVKIKVLNKKIAIIESNCQNQICVNTGYIHLNGQHIVCAPKKIVIAVKNQKKNYITGQ